MNPSPIFRPWCLALATLGLALTVAGCATHAGPPYGRNLSPEQCRDLTALRQNAPPSRARNNSELAALRRAGYDPSLWYDPYYPEDLQAAQRQVDYWYRTECVADQPMQIPPPQ